jgi:hypothetical protein
MSVHPRAAPVPGEVIPKSNGMVLGMIAFLLTMLAGGLVVAWAWWTETALPIYGRISMPGGFGGLLAASIAAVVIPMAVLYLFSGERLVIAEDRLQVLHKASGGDEVASQIPYRNIAKIAMGDDEGSKFIGIDLHDPDDADTFTYGCNFRDEKNGNGWHYRIPGVFQRSLDAIYQMILDRLHAQQKG